jgi:hypothetical protein
MTVDLVSIHEGNGTQNTLIHQDCESTQIAYNARSPIARLAFTRFLALEAGTQYTLKVKISGSGAINGANPHCIGTDGTSFQFGLPRLEGADIGNGDNVTGGPIISLIYKKKA